MLFIVDAKVGLTTDEHTFAKAIKKLKNNQNIILCANKSEGKNHDENINTFYQLGFGEPLLISAAHNHGINIILNIIDQHNYIPITKSIEPESQDIKIAIIGQPNSGKSTLINKIIRENLLTVSNKPGTTTDYVKVKFHYKQNDIVLIDTAGIRKKIKIINKTEDLYVKSSIEAINQAHVAILLIDASKTITTQDLKIANIINKLQKPFVLVTNKWDLLKENENNLRKINLEIPKLLCSNKNKIIKISALKDNKFDHIINLAIKTCDKWAIQIPTTKLNKWLQQAITNRKPNLNRKNNFINIKYCTQIKTQPPTILIFSSSTDISKNYTRYLENEFRKCFDAQGIPINIIFRKN